MGWESGYTLLQAFVAFEVPLNLSIDVTITLYCSVCILQHAPGVPKVLVGNRLHLAFKRQVGTREAELYAAKNSMAFFEVSPLCDFNITESFSELSRRALHRNGMERLWRSNKGKQLITFIAICLVLWRYICILVQRGKIVYFLIILVIIIWYLAFVILWKTFF